MLHAPPLSHKRMPSAAAIAAAACKLHKYGDVNPHVVLPFVVEHAGALGKEAMEHFRRCRSLVKNCLSPQQGSVSTWPSRGFSNFSAKVVSCQPERPKAFFYDCC